MTSSDPRMYLSPPSVDESDIEAVSQAMRSGWLAPAGPELEAFEREMAAYVGATYAVGLSSGTAALHLALRFAGVGPGDRVIVPSLTFAATAFAVTYCGAEPVFVDSEDQSWNLDPDLTELAIGSLRSRGLRVAAVIPVDLYGAPAHYDLLTGLVDRYGIPLIEDAAEGLGAEYRDGTRLGCYGLAGVLSFNGNKIITTSGGGMLVTDREDVADAVRRWSTQARVARPWYEHEEIGYNYRLSNILSALGRSQLARLPDTVARRRQVRDWYREELGDLRGVTIQDDPPWGTSNAWLSVARFASDRYPDAATRVRVALEHHDIESRPVWKPMHLQPVFATSESPLNGFADTLFREGLCLPSGPAMDRDDVVRVCRIVQQVLETDGPV